MRSCFVILRMSILPVPLGAMGRVSVLKALASSQYRRCLSFPTPQLCGSGGSDPYICPNSITCLLSFPPFSWFWPYAFCLGNPYLHSLSEISPPHQCRGNLLHPGTAPCHSSPVHLETAPVNFRIQSLLLNRADGPVCQFAPIFLSGVIFQHALLK